MSPLLQSLVAAAATQTPLHPERVVLHAGQTVYEPGQLRQDVYFPDGALISLVFATDKGHSCEICHLGRNSLLGLQKLIGNQESGYTAIVQQGGEAWRLPAERLRTLLEHNAQVRQLLLQHLQAVLTQVAQLAVCHRHHSLEQQMARLLMQFVDNAGVPRVMLTHERIARLLGVRREGVTAGIGQLSRQGILLARRGCLDVKAPDVLQDFACDCLQKVRQAQRWLP